LDKSERWAQGKPKEYTHIEKSNDVIITHKVHVSWAHPQDPFARQAQTFHMQCEHLVHHACGETHAGARIPAHVKAATGTGNRGVDVVPCSARLSVTDGRCGSYRLCSSSDLGTRRKRDRSAIATLIVRVFSRCTERGDERRGRGRGGGARL